MWAEAAGSASGVLTACVQVMDERRGIVAHKAVKHLGEFAGDKFALADRHRET
jgi:hypothetical protein